MDVATLSIAVDSSNVKSADRAMEAMSETGSKLEGVIKGIVGIWGMWELGKHVTELTTLSARYDTMGIVMGVAGNNAGYTRSQMAGLQQELMLTGISALESRSSLTSLATANIDLASATKLARAAQDVAVVGNMNSSEALANLIHGIKSGQTEILRTLGLNVQFETGYRRVAAAVGKTTQELTEQEKVQSRTNQVLGEAARYAGIYEASMGTAGKQAKSMERYIENLEVQLGSTFQPAYSAGVELLTGAVKGLTKEFEQLQQSGDISVYAVKLKDDLTTAWGAVRTTTGFVIDHRGAIITLAGAYAGFETAKFVNSMIASAASLSAEMQAKRAAITAALAHKEAVITDALAMVGHTYATNEDALAQIAMAQRMVVYNELALSNAEATGAMTAADIAAARAANATTAAKLEEAAAIQGSNAALEAGSVALGGLSGGITTLVTLLGAAAAAWWMFKDSTNKEGQDAIKAANERIEALRRETDAQKRYWEARAKGLSGDEAKASTWAADDEAEVRALTKAYGEAQVKLQELHDARVNGLGTKVNQTLKIGGWATATQGELALEGQMNSILEKRQELVERLTESHAGAAAVEKDYMDKAAAARKLAEGEDKTKTTMVDGGLTEYGKEVQRLSQELVGLTNSEREAFAMKLRLMDKGAGGDISKALGIWDEIEAYKKLKQVTDDQRKDGEGLLDEMLKLHEQYELIGADLETQIRYKLLDKGATEDQIQGMLELTRAIEDKTAALKYQQSLESEADRLNRPAGDSRQRLEDMYKGGLVGTSVYIRQLQRVHQQELQLRMDSGDIWAGMALQIEGFSDNSSSAMARFFNGTKTGFSDMISSLLLDMEKLVIQQQLMKPLMSGISAGMGTMGDGGGWSSFATAFTGAWGGGKASGGSVYPGTTYLVGENGPELLHMGSAGSITPNGSLGQINAPITVIIQTDGTATTKGGESAQNMKALGNLVASKCREVIAIESRPNGLLAR